MMSPRGLLIPTLWKLGPGSLARVGLYRLACRCGIFRHIMPMRPWEGGKEPFFAPSPVPCPDISQTSAKLHLDRATALLIGELDYFSNGLKKIGSPPDWFLDPFTGTRLPGGGHWTRLNEFSGGDIKNVWEASRFEWVPLLARAWRLDHDMRYITTLNDWIGDWVTHNPSNTGPNWKCGQEASIRIINLLLAARLLETHRSPLPSLIRLIAMHCQRIYPTLGYAIAQNNNHGTSEAAALYIGGLWLKSVVHDHRLLKAASRWHERGRRLMENRVISLVAEDGSFSQYSVNYHRVLLDTLSQVELWRRDLDDTPFGTRYLDRCRAAADWLFTLTDPDTGNVPNLGANDGARLYDVSLSSYRDFRPSVQLAMALFADKLAYRGDGSWNDQLIWFDVRLPEQQAIPAGSRLFDDGGYAVVRREGAMVLLRYPRFRFRPSQSDALHVDLWQQGENLFRDAGTYSYNVETEWLNYFSGTESHNTVQFDNRDQMPRIGRFLFGDWLKLNNLQPLLKNSEETSVGAAYRDRLGCDHQRSLRLRNDRLIVRDDLSGFAGKAVLRWRLRPGNWHMEGQNLTDGKHVLTITASVPISSIELVSGWESLNYLQKTKVPVLVVEIHEPGTLTTEYKWMV